MSEDLKVRDLIKRRKLTSRRPLGDRLAARLGARMWERPNVCFSDRLFKRFGLADPWDPTGPRQDPDPIALGPVAVRLGAKRRQPAPHLRPKSPPKKKAAPDPLAKYRRPAPKAAAAPEPAPAPRPTSAPAPAPPPGAPRSEWTTWWTCSRRIPVAVWQIPGRRSRRYRGRRSPRRRPTWWCSPGQGHPVPRCSSSDGVSSGPRRTGAAEWARGEWRPGRGRGGRRPGAGRRKREGSSGRRSRRSGP